MTRTSHSTLVINSSVPAYRVASSVERTAVWVSIPAIHSQDALDTDWPQDIGDFLRDEIKGPATFTCKTGQGCKFEEAAMNELILSIFGDPFISLECEGGECLHFSQIPGYVVSAISPTSVMWSVTDFATTATTKA